MIPGNRGHGTFDLAINGEMHNLGKIILLYKASGFYGGYCTV